MAAVADSDEVRSVRSVDVSMDHAISLNMLFDPGHDLDERIVSEQFGFYEHVRKKCEPRITQTFKFTVNGKPVSVALDNEEAPLLNVLRNELGLMGTRFGCGLKRCGCCTVLIDGVPEKCCAKPVWSVAGKAVVTIEGLGRP